MELPFDRSHGIKKNHDCRTQVDKEQGYGKTLEWVRARSAYPVYGLYCYCDVDIQNTHTHVWIYCYKHAGYFQQTPHGHRTKGCWICSPTRKLTTKEFKKKAMFVHKGRYDYSDTVYVLSSKMVKIICRVHGPFEQLARNHLMGNGCGICYLEKCITSFSEYVRRAQMVHGSKYTYLNDGYTDTRGKVTIVCPKHDKFTQGAHNHLSGNGCPDCAPSFYSMIAISWLNFRAIQLGMSVQHAMSGSEHIIKGSNYRADGYVAKLNLVLEFHGDFWHGNPKKYPAAGINSVNGGTFGDAYKKTLRKQEDIIKAGYKYECIWESEWKRFLRFIVLAQRRFRKRKSSRLVKLKYP